MAVTNYPPIINCYNVSQGHDCQDQRLLNTIVEGMLPTEKTPKDSCHVKYFDGSHVEGDIELINLSIVEKQIVKPREKDSIPVINGYEYLKFDGEN